MSETDPRISDALQMAVDRGEAGVQVAAYVGDHQIVDAWIGPFDPNAPDGPQVDGSTLFPVFSVTKIITATAIHLQAEGGLLSYSDPISTYWPEFGCNGKEGITIAHVLAHQSGIPQMPAGVTAELMCDWDWMIEQVANFTPLFGPGEKSAYQSLVFGWILGEVVRRTDAQHRDFGRFVRDEITTPLGGHDVWLGLPTSELQRAAVLTSELPTEPLPEEAEIAELTRPQAVAPDAPVHNRTDVRQACLPGAGAIGSARACVRVVAMLANGGELDGVRLLAPERVRSFTVPRPEVEELDPVLFGGRPVPRPVGVGGLWLGGTVMGTGPAVLSHGGSGTSVAFADLDSKLSVCIFHNRMFTGFAPEDPNHPFAPLAQAIRDVADPYIRASSESTSAAHSRI
jgi:CubicO group peptidase (beta-lactamase class C family)